MNGPELPQAVKNFCELNGLKFKYDPRPPVSWRVGVNVGEDRPAEFSHLFLEARPSIAGHKWLVDIHGVMAAYEYYLTHGDWL